MRPCDTFILADLLGMLQAGEQTGLRQKAADLECQLCITQKRCADQAAELAAVRRKHSSVGSASASDAGRLACLEGNAPALAQCSLGQLYRSVTYSRKHACALKQMDGFVVPKLSCHQL